MPFICLAATAEMQLGPCWCRVLCWLQRFCSLLDRWLCTPVHMACCALQHASSWLPLYLQKAGAMPPDGAVPEPLILSSEMLDSGGIYLLDNGADLLLYVDQEADDKVVEVSAPDAPDRQIVACERLRRL